MSLNFSIIDGLNTNINNESNIIYKAFIIENIFHYSDDAIVILNEKKHIIEYSKKFSELFNSENLKGESFIKLMNSIVQLPNDFFNEKSYFLTINASDSFRAFKAHINKYASTENDNRYIIILKDINEQQEMQAQKDTFIATLTHDLKTPVRADILSLELLLKGRFGKLNKEQTEIIQELLNSNKFMMNMLDTLLAKYKYESDKVELHKTDFEINEFIKNCVQELHCIFEEKNILCNMISSEKIIINADKIELKRAMSNLLTNAIKFNHQNGFVNITINSDNKNIKIQIQDTGIGMDKEKIEHIFDRYVSYAKRFRRLGTGLGLYVSKKIIEAHNGKIEVQSIEKEGSIFTIILPKN